MKILYYKDKKFYWNEGDLKTHFGVIKEGDIKQNKAITHLGKKFLIFEANFLDRIRRIKRGPAIVSLKDIGLILTNTGITKDSICLDAGTGSGFLSIFLANFCKKVYSYEINKEFYSLAQKNIEKLNIKNIILKNKDVYEKIDEKDLDLITLDLKEPWKALKNCEEALKPGAFLVTYLPTTAQLAELIEKANNFIYIKTVELLERKWKIELPIIRPQSKMIAHTGFLSFFRKP